MRIIIAMFLVLFMSNAVSSENTRAKVIYAGVTGAGTVFVHVDKVINEPGCSTGSLWIHPDASEAVKNQVLSTALVAFAAKKDVYVKSNGCYSGNPTFDTTNNSWIHIYPVE